MEKEFVPYELALKMKNLGFNEPCFAIWTKGWTEFEWGSNMLPRLFSSKFRLNDTQSYEAYFNNPNASFGVAAPTFSQAFRWFKDEHGLYISISPKKSYPDGYVSGIEWAVSICGGNGEDIGPDGVFTYIEAELICLERLIELIENESNREK